MVGLSPETLRKLWFACVEMGLGRVLFWGLLGCRNACRLSIGVPGEYTTTLRV